MKIMGIYVNPGNEEFENIVNSEIYVDKTDLLQYTNLAINTEQRYLCMSRPRRFGKSITANMLAAYYSKACDSGKLFAPYKIAQIANCEKYRNKYGVIHVDMNVFRHRRKAGSNETVTACETVGVFQEEVIAELRKEYPDCIAEKECDLPNALINIHMQTGEKFVIIIDEWDTIFREDKEDEKAQKLYITLLRGLFKDNNARKFVALGYITGILPIKKYGTESALNNFREYTMVNSGKMAEYIGFTEQEVKELCKQYNMDDEELKHWYDGYSFQRVKHIYNPKAVVDSIRRRKFANYWTKTETYDSLKNYISMNFDGLKDSIINMLTGARVKVDTNMFENDMTGFKNRDDILTVLIHLGYLAYDATKQEVYIPNEEIRSAFSIAIKNSKWKYTVEAIEASDLLS